MQALTKLRTMKRNLAAAGVASIAALSLIGAASAAPASAALNITLFKGALSAPDGSPVHKAGAHPDLITQIGFETKLDGNGLLIPAEFARNIEVDLPPGLVGTPAAFPQCSDPQLVGDPVLLASNCPRTSQIGTLNPNGLDGLNPTGLYNIEPPVGAPAMFGANYLGSVVRIIPEVTTDGEYRITSNSFNTSQGINLRNVVVKIWGVPADPAHDGERGGSVAGLVPLVPLLSNPTSCPSAPLRFDIRADSWQTLGVFDTDSFDTDLNGDPLTITDCNQIDFNPSIQARPTTNVADSPSGLDVSVKVPQNADPDGRATANLRDASITLPPGMTVNPSSAQGLGACTPAQVGLTSPVGQPRAQFDEAPASCPDAAKLGTVVIDTPATIDPLQGTLYLATQNQNPFGSLIALYMVIDDPQTGVRIKLAGQAVPDPNTGQLRIDFDHNPQLPFNELKVQTFTGPRAALKTPMACGNHTTTSSMVPWSSPEGATKAPTDTFAITNGADNTPCLKSESEAPNKPSFSAGTSDPAAGAYSPFTLRISRADGTQPIKAIDTTLPKGLLGKLAGISYCPDANLAGAASKSGRAEQASASCPASSLVGNVTVGAGAGSTPVFVAGKAYLAGPYKGAPLSLAVVTPAVAGPFDLGTVVIRNALNVDPETTQIHAVSDQIPTILQGIPLDIRSIVVSMDRPQFTLNPTSCSQTSVLGGATSLLGQTASLSARFQVGGCKALGFKPKLAIGLKGGTKRSEFPALRATLKARPGDANIGKAVVSLPHSEFLAQSHIRTICTRVQFAANACPPGSIYGKATAWSPLIDKPLTGPVYLRSSSNKLPDLVADLSGQIRVSLVGRIDSVKGGIRTTFASVPDAPVSKFVLEMAGGKKGLLENSRNLCNSVNKADVKLDGQNGKTADSAPVVTNSCKKSKSKKKSASKGSRH